LVPATDLTGATGQLFDIPIKRLCRKFQTFYRHQIRENHLPQLAVWMLSDPLGARM
jgi:hypothetical protein